MHQEITLCQHLTVAENIFMHAMKGEGKGFVRFRAINAMARKLLSDFDSHALINPRQKVSDLSVSQQQVVEIVKAISANCRVIIFDEPTAALTESETAALFRIIGTLRGKGMGVIYISHRLAEIYTIADTVTVLRDGALIDTKPVKDIDQVSLVNLMVGRELKDIYPPKGAQGAGGGEVLLEVKDLAMEGEFSGVSFTLHKGESSAWVGSSAKAARRWPGPSAGCIARARGTCSSWERR